MIRLAVSLGAKPMHILKEMKAGQSPGNDNKVSILLPYNGKFLVAIKLCETVRIGYIYNLVILNFGKFVSHYHARAYITCCDTVGYYNYYIIGKFEIWR